MRIELDHVVKRFGRTAALDGIDLTIASGARVALLGPNGSGKTTLTRAIMGLVRCEGEIRLDGRPLTDRMAVAHRLAYVPQIAPMMAATVDDMVGAVCGLRGLTRGVVAERAAELGLEIDAVRARPLRNLSGGMRQKLLIALAMATPADLIILDEPTASLDAAARSAFLARCARTTGATVILCSHRLDELRALVDHVVVLAEGKLTHDEPAADYLAERLAGVIELRVTGTRAAAWLDGQGFSPGTAGWWSRSVTSSEKRTLLEAALAALGGDVLDLVVRDRDRLASEEVSRAA